jgi:hypothetical protein
MRTAGILATALALLAAPAGAQESKCTAAKHAATGDYARALEACRAKALKKGVEIDPACDAKALAKLEAQFAKAEKKADCVVSSEEDFAAAVTDEFVADLAATLQRGSGVCCKLPTACGWVTDPALCEGEDGVPGAAGTVCDGSGECVAAPVFGGACCETPDTLRCRLDLTADQCGAAAGAAFVDPAVCTTSRCIRFEGTPPS